MGNVFTRLFPQLAIGMAKPGIGASANSAAFQTLNVAAPQVSPSTVLTQPVTKPATPRQASTISAVGSLLAPAGAQKKKPNPLAAQSLIPGQAAGEPGGEGTPGKPANVSVRAWRAAMSTYGSAASALQRFTP